jgi:hypothetical protein
MLITADSNSQMWWNTNEPSQWPYAPAAHMNVHWVTAQVSLLSQIFKLYPVNDLSQLRPVDHDMTANHVRLTVVRCCYQYIPGQQNDLSCLHMTESSDRISKV